MTTIERIPASETIPSLPRFDQSHINELLRYNLIPVFSDPALQHYLSNRIQLLHTEGQLAGTSTYSFNGKMYESINPQKTRSIALRTEMHIEQHAAFAQETNAAKKIKQAAYLAYFAHGTNAVESKRSRKTGERYYNHVENVAINLMTHGYDLNTVIIGYLHDVMEDTAFTFEDIKQLFGIDIARNVAYLTKVEFNSVKNPSGMDHLTIAALQKFCEYKNIPELAELLQEDQFCAEREDKDVWRLEHLDRDLQGNIHQKLAEYCTPNDKKKDEQCLTSYQLFSAMVSPYWQQDLRSLVVKMADISDNSQTYNQYSTDKITQKVTVARGYSTIAELLGEVSLTEEIRKRTKKHPVIGSHIKDISQTLTNPQFLKTICNMFQPGQYPKDDTTDLKEEINAEMLMNLFSGITF